MVDGQSKEFACSGGLSMVRLSEICFEGVFGFCHLRQCWMLNDLRAPGYRQCSLGVPDSIRSIPDCSLTFVYYLTGFIFENHQVTKKIKLCPVFEVQPEVKKPELPGNTRQ